MRRALALVGMVAVAAVAWLSFAVPALAQTQLQTVVTVSATSPMAVHGQCFAEPTTEPGSFTLHRTIAEAPLTVTYHISGGPTDLNSDPVAGEDHTVQFPQGQAEVTVEVHPGGGLDTETATVEVVDGEAYNAGDPDTGDVTVNKDTPTCASPTTVATPDTLARTGVRPTTAPLTLTGIVMVALGAVLLAGAARRRTAG